jgi:hypothetical protein
MLRDFAEQLRQQMLVRLAKPASEKKLKLPPIVDGDVHTSPSPLQVHPSNTDLTPGEVKDVEPDGLSDTMTPIGPTAGRPKLEDEDGKGLPPIKGAGGNLRTLLTLVGAKDKTHYHAVASHHANLINSALSEAIELFPSLKKIAKSIQSGSMLDKLHLVTAAPAHARMLRIREILDAGGVSGARRQDLEKEYKFYHDGIYELEKHAVTVLGSDKKTPGYPDERGILTDESGGASVKGDGNDDKPAAEPTGEAKETAAAKKAKFGAAAALNPHLLKILGGLRMDLLGAALPEKWSEIQDELIQAHIAKASAAGERMSKERAKAETMGQFEAEKTSRIERLQKMLRTYSKLEAVVSSNEVASHAIAASSSDSMRNFASWYSVGATRTLASIMDLVNSSPVYKLIRGKLGRVVAFHPKTGREVSDDYAGEKHYRVQFDNEKQAYAAAMVMSLIGPTSSNEKPSSNARVALSILEDGLHQWHQNNRDKPDVLANPPSIIEIMAAAKHDRGHLGIGSEFGNQHPKKYFSGLYHSMSKRDQLKLANKFGLVLLNRSQDDLPPAQKMAEMLKKNIAAYHRNDDGDNFLVPMKPTKKDAGRGRKAMVDFILSASKLGKGRSSDIHDLLDLAHKNKDDDVFVGDESDATYGLHVVHDANGAVIPKGFSGRPRDTKKYLNIISMFNHAADIARIHADKPEEERARAIADSLMTLNNAAGQNAFEALGLSQESLKAMFKPERGKTLTLDDAKRMHAENLAQYVASQDVSDKDQLASMFLAGMHGHPMLNSMIPVSRNTWFTGGDHEPWTYHGAVGSAEQLPGMTLQGPKFGPYALGVSSPALASLSLMMNGFQPPIERYVADRVMMELHSDALGRLFGGTPESEIQRAAFNHAMKNLGAFLGKQFGGRALTIGELQAIAWGATQAAVSSLGGDNPTEQLYTGAERAYRLHRIHANRVIEYYKSHPELVTPGVKSMVDEYQHFIDNSTTLRTKTMANGVAYANLQDTPYVATAKKSAGKRESAERRQTLENVGVEGARLDKDIRRIGKDRRFFAKELAHDGSGRGDTAAVRADSREAARKIGAAIRRKLSLSRSAQRGDAPPVPALDGRSPFRAKRGAPAATGRHAAAGAAPDAPGAPGAGRPERLKFSGQFMRSMLLGTSSTAQAFRKQLDGIAEQIGVKVKSYNGVGDGLSESVPATAHISPQALDHDTTRYLAAWAGLLGGRKSVMMFHPDPSGQDSLYSIRLPLTNMQDVRATLDRRGVKHRTIIPGGTKTHVIVYDPKKIMRAAVAQLAEEHDADVLESIGHAEFIGRPTNSPSADADADAREHYRRIVADFEERRGVPDQAGAVADGGGGGAPVPGAAAAGRAPAGGNIVRGLTYKGGAFTPAAEQKSPPQKQPGGLERFQKRVKLNRAKRIADGGAANYSGNVDNPHTMEGDIARNVVTGTSFQPRQTGPVGNANSTGRFRASGAVSTPAESYNAPTGETVDDSHPLVPSIGGLYLAASQIRSQHNYAGINNSHATAPSDIALPHDIDALRHMVRATASQGISPYQRYGAWMNWNAERKYQGYALGIVDEMQNALGMACAAKPELMKALSSDQPLKVNHDTPLNAGVTRLSGMIVPHQGNLPNGTILTPRGSFFAALDLKNAFYKPGPLPEWRHITYIPLSAAQYGLVDNLVPGRGGETYYGTPDGHVFLMPEHANRHMENNPRVAGLHGQTHEPWYPIQKRVQTFAKHDDLIKRIASDNVLSKAETSLDPIVIAALSGGLPEDLISKVRRAFAGEPARFGRLLNILADGIGGNSPTETYGAKFDNRRKDWRTTDVTLMNPGGDTRPMPPGQLGMHAGIKYRNELEHLVQRISSLFKSNLYGPSYGNTIGVGVARMPALGQFGSIGLDRYRHEIASEYSDGNHVDPAGILALAKNSSPGVIAHEVGHWAESHIPGISRAVTDHMFTNGTSGGPLMYKSKDPGSKIKGVFANMDIPWSSGHNADYARQLYPSHFVHREPGYWPDAPSFTSGDTNEYFPQMLMEFFTRPVKLAREHPNVARFVLGLMDGSLRDHK